MVTDKNAIKASCVTANIEKIVNFVLFLFLLLLLQRTKQILV